MTVPLAAAEIGVPVGAAMSMPSCMRPQRQPKPLVIGPLTGHTSPLEEVPFPLEPFAPYCLLNGQDDIDYLLGLREQIREFDLKRATA